METSTMTYVPSADDLEVITREVWMSFLDGDPAGLVAGGSALGEDRVTGCIQLSGMYVGAIMLELAPAAAQAAAAALFGMAPGDVGPVEVADAVGEITNMVGGNVKSMLPGPSTLSLPAVVYGQLTLPGVQMVRRAELTWRGQPLAVSLWRQGG
ncbi:MAG: chemotaxis protein CheX [Acidothermus sp.]|nr:chemotaxis protein CheX [Acidothermus sp.]MCL6537074.1 chemotaxis protein CheX [Acidothermus sp.]